MAAVYQYSWDVWISIIILFTELALLFIDEGFDKILDLGVGVSLILLSLCKEMSGGVDELLHIIVGFYLNIN